MKTTLLAKSLLIVLLTLVLNHSFAQNTGLVFNNPVLKSGNALKKGSVYIFRNVFTGVDATVTVDTLANGAELTKIDDNSGGLGYTNAFQPEIKIPKMIGEAYVGFTFRFFEAGTYDAGTKIPKIMDNVQGTTLDIDGNLLLKEFSELDMNGGAATFNSILDISVLQVLLRKFRGDNLLGIERDGIDTSAYGNMFTVSKQGISSFTAKFGATSLNAGSSARQYSLYMKGFNYPNQQVILPVEMESFTAMLDNNKADLKWVTATEKNVSHFVIEKSTDGKTFTDAGMVFAYGNTTEEQHYSFADNVNMSQAGVIYYRLRTVDLDGKYKYSDIRVIRISKQNDQLATISTYPNPVSNELKVTVPNSWQNKKASFLLFNANGQVVKQVETASAGQTQLMDMSALTPGFYVVKVSCQGEIVQQKIIKN